jgi:hypothetical protein
LRESASSTLNYSIPLKFDLDNFISHVPRPLFSPYRFVRCIFIKTQLFQSLTHYHTISDPLPNFQNCTQSSEGVLPFPAGLSSIKEIISCWLYRLPNDVGLTANVFHSSGRLSKIWDATIAKKGHHTSEHSNPVSPLRIQHRRNLQSLHTAVVFFIRPLFRQGANLCTTVTKAPSKKVCIIFSSEA